MILNCKCGWSHMDAYELNGGNLEMQLETNIGSKLPLSTSLLLPVSLSVCVRKTGIEREKETERDC